MNQVEMSVAMKKYYDAKWVAAANAFRFRKNDRVFDLTVQFGQSNNSMRIWIDRMYIEERIMPDDDFGKVKKKVLASLDTSPKDMTEVRKWINRTLIAAFLDEHCETPQSKEQTVS